MTDIIKKPKGFAAMDKETAFKIHSMGGNASPSNFKNNRELARRAGALGGAKSRKPKAGNES
jgi:general stress protein YciG